MNTKQTHLLVDVGRFHAVIRRRCAGDNTDDELAGESILGVESHLIFILALAAVDDDDKTITAEFQRLEDGFVKLVGEGILARITLFDSPVEFKSFRQKGGIANEVVLLGHLFVGRNFDGREILLCRRCRLFAGRCGFLFALDSTKDDSSNSCNESTNEWHGWTSCERKSAVVEGKVLCETQMLHTIGVGLARVKQAVRVFATIYIFISIYWLGCSRGLLAND